MRKTILNIIGSIVILVLALMVFRGMSSGKKAPKKNNQKAVSSVTVQEVVNQTLPLVIESTGPLVAKNRIVISSEVQGVFQRSSKAFKAGESYTQGQVLLQINNAEFAASVQSQRIAFKGLITSILADIKFDYPAYLEAWQSYAKSIQPNQAMAPLPQVEDPGLNNYLNVKNIPTNYYNIKNLETKLAKFVIRAPFNGVLVQANVNPGTLISPGQSLGEFIQIGVYELQLNVNASLLDYLQIDKLVNLEKVEGQGSFKAKVSRINPQVNQATQTAQVFVQVNSRQLKEGEYVMAQIEAEAMEKVITIDRNIIVDNTYVFLEKDGKLVKKQIQVLNSNGSQTMIRGLQDGDRLVNIPLIGAYDGMSVTVRD